MMMSKFVTFQGCSSMLIGMAKDLDVPVLSVTVGMFSIIYLYPILSFKGAAVVLTAHKA